MQTKKPDSFESGYDVNLQKFINGLYLQFGHSIPDSYKVLFIRFFTVIICSKCSHHFFF
jgi:hypothetical protein